MKKGRKIFAVLLSVLLMFVGSLPMHANSPYLGYTYNFWAVPVPAPVAYMATRTITAEDISGELGRFINPMDMCVTDEGHIHLLDTGNNRIVVFDQDLYLIRVIDSFIMDGEEEHFNSPNGIFICVNSYIYIADTENRRIVVLDLYGNFVSVIQNPDLGDIDDEVDFRPLRVAVDSAGRVYVIVWHVFEGIMRFDQYGNFFGYFGTINVRVSAADLFWRMIATTEQRARMRRFIPTEFTGLDVDDYGFVFATHSHSAYGWDQVMRINPRGNNVLRNYNENTYFSGVQGGARMFSPSHFVDVVARPYGKFSVLDGTCSRIYTYDSEGNMLYVFGGESNIMGMARRPVAINTIGDTIIILDAARGRIIYFEPTDYGKLINEAVALRYDGYEEESVEAWRQVLLINEHSELAFTGVGRAYLLAGEYVLAMDYLLRGMDLRYYSMALARRRELFIDRNLPLVLTVGMVLILSLVTYSIVHKIRHIGYEEGEDI